MKRTGGGANLGKREEGKSNSARSRKPELKRVREKRDMRSGKIALLGHHSHNHPLYSQPPLSKRKSV